MGHGPPGRGSRLLTYAIWVRLPYGPPSILVVSSSGQSAWLLTRMISDRGRGDQPPIGHKLKCLEASGFYPRGTGLETLMSHHLRQLTQVQARVNVVRQASQAIVTEPLTLSAKRGKLIVNGSLTI